MILKSHRHLIICSVYTIDDTFSIQVSLTYTYVPIFLIATFWNYLKKYPRINNDVFQEGFKMSYNLRTNDTCYNRSRRFTEKEHKGKKSSLLKKRFKNSSLKLFR